MVDFYFIEMLFCDKFFSFIVGNVLSCSLFFLVIVKFDLYIDVFVKGFLE